MIPSSNLINTAELSIVSLSLSFQTLPDTGAPSVCLVVSHGQSYTFLPSLNLLQPYLLTRMWFACVCLLSAHFPPLCYQFINLPLSNCRCRMSKVGIQKCVQTKWINKKFKSIHLSEAPSQVTLVAVYNGVGGR